MMTLLVYTLKSALVLALLYLPYTLMLQRERFFRLNRLTLLAVLLLAVVLPLWKVTSPASLNQVPMIADTQEMVCRMETIVVGGSSSEGGTGAMLWLAYAYAAGVALMLGIRICQLVQIRWALRRGCLWRQREEDGITVCCHVGNGAPFSWMRSIYISETDYNQNGRAILLHERAHIHCRHSLDILLLIVVEAVQWWNPVVYLLGNSLRNVHEYEADDYVLRQGVSLSDYQALLVRKVASKREQSDACISPAEREQAQLQVKALADTTYAFANNFNRSHILKRIEMMKRPPSKAWLRAKVLYVVPILLFTLIISATPIMEPLFILDGEKVDYERVSRIPPDSIWAVSVLHGSTATAVFGERGRHGAVIIDANTYDTPPEFEGGHEAMQAYTQRHLTYPTELTDYGIQGQLRVKFTVETDGTISDVIAEVDTQGDEGADAVVYTYQHDGMTGPSPEEVDRLMNIWKKSAEQMIAGMPRFRPAMKNGKPVKARIQTTLHYRLV